MFSQNGANTVNVLEQLYIRLTKAVKVKICKLCKLCHL